MGRAMRVCVAGLSSNVGKTTLVCHLLGFFPGWEAIKVSRGHYRSCGRDPQACCVSPLLGREPRLLSGRAETGAPGKDTGRYWEAGAGNVHWLVCTSEQVEAGTRAALDRVAGAGVIIEGTSLLKYIQTDYNILVADPARAAIKSSVMRVLDRMDAVFLNAPEPREEDLEQLRQRLARRGARLKDVPAFGVRDLTRLAEEINRVRLTRAAG